MKKIVTFVNDLSLEEIAWVVKHEKREFIELFGFEDLVEFKSFVGHNIEHKLIFIQIESLSDFKIFELLLSDNKNNMIALLSHESLIQEFIRKGNYFSTFFLDLNLQDSIKAAVQVGIDAAFFPAKDNFEIEGVSFNPKGILFIENSLEHKNCVIIHGRGEKMVRAPLKKFAGIRDYLVRIDRSLIVNINQIKAFDKDKLEIEFFGTDKKANVTEYNMKKVVQIMMNNLEK